MLVNSSAFSLYDDAMRLLPAEEGSPQQRADRSADDASFYNIL